MKRLEKEDMDWRVGWRQMVHCGEHLMDQSFPVSSFYFLPLV